MSLARLRVLRPAWPTLLPHKRKTEAVKLAVLHPKDIPHYDLRDLPEEFEVLRRDKHSEVHKWVAAITNAIGDKCVVHPNRLKDKDHFQITFSGMVYFLHTPSNHKQDLPPVAHTRSECEAVLRKPGGRESERMSVCELVKTRFGLLGVEDGHELSSHQKKSLLDALAHMGVFGHQRVPTVPAVGSRGIRDPEAIADRLTYLLSASSPPGALRKLCEIFRLVESHDVRLCLRARGWLPKLLSQTATLWKQASCLSESRSSTAADFWRGGIWYSLSADCGAACDILEVSLEEILSSAEDHHFAVQRDVLRSQAKPETASPKSGLLKRRRSGYMVVGPPSMKKNDDNSAVEVVVQRIREYGEAAAQSAL
eukprot:s4639_g2.t1